MADFCTCGVQTVPDARFCHKCGRPLYELTPVEEPQPVAPPLPPPIPEVSFRNSVAVRVGLLIAALGFPFVFALAGLPAIVLGFVAAWVYTRRTGQDLSVQSGARMGWITGTFLFAISTVLITVSVLFLVSDAGQEALRSYSKFPGLSPARVAEVQERLAGLTESPASILVALAYWFVLLTLLPAAGGALGALWKPPARRTSSLPPRR